MSYPCITDDDHAAFRRDGYVLKRGFFDAGEIALLDRAIVEDSGVQANLIAFDDAQGGSTTLALWNHPGDDLFGAFARVERMVGGMERLLGGEVYHYHSKLTMKRPGGGGLWNWHQDYGYWYNNGCLFPDMASVAIAVEPATRENGCLEVLRGSHLLGRLDHGKVGGQAGADVARVAEAEKVLDHVYVEMDAGDALFFHCNTLHSSAPNTSARSRNILLCCYNSASNDPYKEHHHPRYTPLARMPDDAIARMGLKLEGKGRVFFAPEDDDITEGKRVEAEG